MQNGNFITINGNFIPILQNGNFLPKTNGNYLKL